MKDEIKEILELTIQFVEEELDKGTPKKDIIKLYSTQVGEAFNHIKNYITNLQEENKNLKDYLKIMEKGKDNNLNRFLDYKSRNEKAIKYIIDNCVLSDEWKDLDFCNFIPTGIIEYKKLSKTKIKYLLNILNGDDNGNI